MKAKKIYYKKLISLGNYQNEEIGVEIEIEEGEKADDVLKAAKEFVERNNPTIGIEKAIEKAREVLKYKANHSYAAVVEAEQIVKEYEAAEAEDLPF